MCQSDKGNFFMTPSCRSEIMYSHVTMHLGLNVSNSARNCGCVVNGGNLSIIIIII